ncbi:MAG: M48 family metalloprotease [Paracoccaceae bacterium]|nr:M48 family metalloprotease [Paracoccaceae bacterium]
MIKIFLISLASIIIGALINPKVGKKNNQKLISESTILSEPLLKSLTNRIAKSLNLAEIPVRVHEVKSFNGLATSEGQIFLTRGALDDFYNGKVTAEELSSIIAHELGHVALGHAKRRMVDFSMQNALRIILSLALSRLIPAIGTYIANFITSILKAKLSRNDEYEADAYAAALLVKSGIGAEAQISLLKKLETLGADRGSIPQWLMSHPKTADRIFAIEQLIEKWGSKD